MLLAKKLRKLSFTSITYGPFTTELLAVLASNPKPCSASFLQAHNTIMDLQKREETLSQELQLRLRFARLID